MRSGTPLTWVLFLALTTFGCGDPPTRVGDPCQADSHCGTEGDWTLTCDYTTPGGACAVAACTLDDPATEALEDADSCPAGSRCVEQADGQRICRRSCDLVGDCRSVIVCGTVCETVDAVEECHETCSNSMECALLFPAADPPDDAPRVCLLKDSR